MNIEQTIMDALASIEDALSTGDGAINAVLATVAAYLALVKRQRRKIAAGVAAFMQAYNETE